MSHTYIDTSTLTGLNKLILYKQELSLDKKDNLHLIPQVAAVYAICGRVNGQTVNCRFVGQTEDLQASIQQHFNEDDVHDCVLSFMRSIKIKELLYVTMPGSTMQEREEVKVEWEKKFKPVCNEELNRVY